MDSDDFIGWDHSSNSAMPIIGAEDEEFENDEMTEKKCPAFNTIEGVKGRPTHLLVFLQHVILQFDCAPLLCYLHAELFKTHNSKETKKYFVEFYNNFLDKGAVLRVTVPANTLSELERTRADLSEEQQKQYAQEIQDHQVAEVAKQLDDFRQKRKMGMTTNEAELSDVENHHCTDRIPMEMKEKSVAENLLDKMAESQSNIVSDEEKCQSIIAAVAFYMKHLGVKTRAVDSKKSRGFFRRPLKKKEEVTKTKPRTGFIPSWMSVNTEGKPKEAEVDKEKPQERKGPAPSKGSLDPAVPSFSSRKSGTSGGSASLSGSELSEGSGVNTATANSPDSITSDGVPCIRSDPLPLTEGGEVFVTVPTIAWGEPVPPETPTEENLEKDSIDGALSVMEAPGPSPTSPPPELEEMDPRLVELEKDPPNWRDSASSDTLASLSKKEIKRQEVINELFATEHAHVRMLSVLQTVFYKPLGREEIFTVEELNAIFPSLEEITDMHYAFLENLRKLRVEDNFIVKSIGTTLLNRFGGTEGEWFQKLTARYCSHQSWALDQIKSRQKKDTRCNTLILEAEGKSQCRRLQLKDIIPIEMQRLTKYPLLLENIAKSTEDQVEKETVQQSAEFCRKILNHVNEEVKDMENLLTVKDYQRRLDTSGLRPSTELYTEYKNIDLTQRKMIYEGPLTWRVTKEKAIEVQCVLLEDLLVLLQRQDDKMVLKCQSKSNIVQEGGRQMLSPIIKLDSVFLREVATDRKAFYVIFTWDSGAQIYELVAQYVPECKSWTDVIKKAVDDLKKSGLHQKLPLPPGGPPLSPSALSAPLSPTENGGLKSTSDRDKDGLTDDNSTNTRHLLIDYLSEKGFDLIGHTNSDQEKVANCALDEVMSLKRLLVTSISLSDDFQLDENGGEAPERTDQDTDGCQSTEERQIGDSGAGADHIADGTEAGGQVVKAGEEDGGISAPLVLSKERMEEVRRRLQSLEEQLTRLQTVEEAHHRLQEALSKFSLEGGNLQ